ncbi:site-specific integrase [Sporolactobacillus shoreae]|uniref:Site-specific integrase n=1 Tax=Sporolactobacillus shoreae TaxID=1465501 RepID=A0A4Z0GR85_9BACL|nr:site-specific integrase [Sporolactobacillus shoreae]TGA98638.1 site-specific integrase [Sporolactobacillus shoreae]
MQCEAQWLSKGTYKLIISLGNDGSGRYPRKTKQIEGIKNKGQLEEAKAGFIYEVSHGLIDDQGAMLFRDLVKDWYTNHLNDKSPRTIEGYESNLRLRIIPTFGLMRTDKIEKYHIRRFFDKLQQPDCEFNSILMNPDIKSKDRTGDYFTSTDQNDFIIKKQKYNLSAKSIDNHKICMNSIFSYAVYKGWRKDSPMKGVKTPKIKKMRPEIYDRKDLAALFQVLESEPLLWRTIVWFAIGTGAREGEIAGFDRRYMNLDKGLALICQAAIRVKKQGVKIKSTKSGNERINNLPSFVIQLLELYDAAHEADKDAAGDTWIKEWKGEPCDFLFTPDGSFGRPMRPESISQWWRRFLKRKNLKHIKFHALRHTSVSLLIDEGDSMKAISERVGHAKIDTTMDIYGQLFETGNERSARLLDKAISEIKKVPIKK